MLEFLNTRALRIIPAAHKRGIDPETEETAVGYLKRGEYQKAEAVFRMLVDTFDGYAEGGTSTGNSSP